MTLYLTPSISSRPEMAVPEQISALVVSLRQALTPSQIWLFGSRARGDARPDSDWDLLAVLPDAVPDDLADPIVAWQIAREHDVPATILTTKRRQLDDIWGLPNTIGYDLSREGIRLVVG